MSLTDTKEYKELLEFIESPEFQKFRIEMIYCEILNDALAMDNKTTQEVKE